jgi:glycine cleavage system T protein (aminomethyltransferase)
MDAMPGIRRTPLEDEHVALGAKLGPFAGWQMPIEYPAGTLAEHRAVREAVGLFDLTHLGKIFVEGPGGLSMLQRTFSNDVAALAAGQAQYNLCLNDEGGIVDDVIVYRLGETRFLVVPNAANRERVYAMLEPEGDVTATIEEWTLLAPQGPRSRELVSEIFPEAASLEYMHCAESRYLGTPMVVSRSGYTGELGYELIGTPVVAHELWRELLGKGMQPAGLGARDTLRLEMGYPLHGQDIATDRTPLEAGLSWACAFDKDPPFRGRDALLRQREEGIPSRLWGLRMRGRLIPRPHFPVLADGAPVGETTSGTFSPTLRAGVALGYLAPRERFAAGDTVEIDVRGRRGEAEVVKPPFVDRSPK